MGYGLKNLIQTRAGGLQPVVDAINDLVRDATVRYNSEVGPRALGRSPSETLPLYRKQLTAFRTRVGTVIEYTLGIIIDEMLQDDAEGLIFSYVVVHQYPDFYVRAADRTILLRIDFKALHNESDEYSARFATSQADLSPNDDVLIYVAWEWRQIAAGSTEVVYPAVLETLCVPAIEVALERDLRLVHTGGRMDSDGKPWVPAKNTKTGEPPKNPWSSDTNYGKIDRIVHGSRIRDNLTPNMQRFVDFAGRYTTARSDSKSATPSKDEQEPI